MINSSMKNILLLLVAVFVVILTMMHMSPHGEEIEQKFDRTETPMEITVFLYPNNAAVTTEYRLRHNIPRTSAFPTVEGFAMWPEWRDKDGNPTDGSGNIKCEIHSVKPRKVDDTATLTLGHELLHCLYGSYHREHF